MPWLDPSRTVFPEYFSASFWRTKHKGPARCTGRCPSGLHRSTGGRPWVGVGTRALETAICMAVLAASPLWGSPGAGIDAGAQLPSGAPLTARPGLALIDDTGAAAWAQVAAPGQPLAPSRHGPAGDRGVGKERRHGAGASVSPN